MRVKILWGNFPTNECEITKDASLAHMSQNTGSISMKFHVQDSVVVYMSFLVVSLEWGRQKGYFTWKGGGGNVKLQEFSRKIQFDGRKMDRMWSL